MSDVQLMETDSLPMPTPADGGAHMIAPTPPSEENKMDTSTPDPLALAETDFQSALKKLAEGKKKIVKSSVKFMIKLLSKLEESPDVSKNRKIQITKNFSYKKHIGDIKGAEDFLGVVGWTRVKKKKKERLEISLKKLNKPILARALELLQAQEDGIESAPVKPGKRVLCAAGCGFWGSTATENLCSQCYKKQYMGVKGPKKQKRVERIQCKGKNCRFWGSAEHKGFCSSCWKKELKDHPTPWQERVTGALYKLKATRLFQENIMPAQKHKNRCYKCHRKVGLVGIECRCRYIFCGKCRYPDMHNCTYDHKRRQRRVLEKQLERVAADKFEKLD